MSEFDQPFGPAHGFGLYIHWPYCSKICPYCDFNVYAAKDRDNSALMRTLRDDLARHRRFLPDHPQLGSVYFGGGTPSLMQAADIAALVDDAQRLFGLEPDAEITLEANPNDVLAADLAGWAVAGVNRLSVGLQSLDDAALAFLGRDHDASNARRAQAIAARHFPNHTIDLIYARPGQSLAEWEAELTEALALGAPHLSLYELTIAEKTAFAQRAARGELEPMDDDAQADLYELTDSITRARGLPAYEVSNHAASNAFRSRHNLTYWRGGDWIGIGPGAHGRLSLDRTRLATHAALRPDDYVGKVSTSPDDIDSERLSPQDTARELLALGLRSNEGVNLDGLAEITGRRPDNGTLDDLIGAGMLSRTGQMLALTRQGRLLADRITAELSP